MNLQHLRYFLAIVRAGGFTRAARDLHVTQPTVSSGIAELERLLGTRLFNRAGRRVDLTLEGRALLTYALQIEDLVDEAVERVRKGNVLTEQGFRFGAIDAAVIYLLPDILQSYRDAHPHVELSTQVASSRYLVEDLLMNRSEFAVITLPFEHPRIATLSLVRDEMPLVAGAGHRLAGRAAAAAEIAAEPLILFHSESVSRRIVDERFAELGITPRVAMEMRSPEAMRKLVESGMGISFLPRMTVAESLAAGTVCVVPAPELRFEREIGLAWRKGRYFGPAIRSLLDAVADRFGKLEPWRESQSPAAGGASG